MRSATQKYGGLREPGIMRFSAGAAFSAGPVAFVHFSGILLRSLDTHVERVDATEE